MMKAILEPAQAGVDVKIYVWNLDMALVGDNFSVCIYIACCWQLL
jgi:hypothetical protein